MAYILSETLTLWISFLSVLETWGKTCSGKALLNTTYHNGLNSPKFWRKYGEKIQSFKKTDPNVLAVKDAAFN